MTRFNELHTELNRLSPGALARTTDIQVLINKGRQARAELLSGMARNAFQAIGRAARSIGFDDVMAVLANSKLARARRCRRTIAELNQLSDRMLADIGLTRSQIVEVATLLAAPADGTRRHSKLAQQSIFVRMRLAQQRRKSIRELEQLPDRILADIGIARGRIPAAVDEIMEKRNAPVATSITGGSPVHGLLAHLEGAVRPLRQWQLSRLAAGQIARLGSATLADLGYVKGDVDWVPEVLASRKIANTSQPQHRSEAGAA
jgi:uncharacterized protein YjiS (DUF1127 family)